MALEAGIFDIDGLLIDSEPFWRQGHMAAVTANGGRISEEDVRAMAGHRTDEVVENWRKNFGVGHVSAVDLESAIVRQVISNIREHGQALPGAYKVLKMFKTNGKPVALASSSAPQVIEAVVETLGLGEFIQFAHSAKFERRGKPYPDVFLTAAKKLGVTAANCVVFEDALSGYKAAEAAKMKCILVPDPVNFGRSEFTHADLVVNSLDEIEWPMIEALWAA